MSCCRRLCCICTWRWIPCRHAFARGECLKRLSTGFNGITHTLLRRAAMSEQSCQTCTLPRPFFMLLALPLRNDAHFDQRNTPRIEHFFSFFYGGVSSGSFFALLCIARRPTTFTSELQLSVVKLAASTQLPSYASARFLAQLGQSGLRSLNAAVTPCCYSMRSVVSQVCDSQQKQLVLLSSNPLGRFVTIRAES